MYILTRIYTRPRADIPFYFEKFPVTKEFKDYIAIHHPDSIQKNVLELSNDRLTLTTRTYWTSRGSLLRFRTDHYCYTTSLVPFMEYNAVNGIVNVSTTAETRE